MRICAGGILVRGDEILLARRSEGRTFYPGVWDVVGGHCADNEAPTDTLIREIEEEIGVRALVFEEIAVLSEPQPAIYGAARYHMFLVTAWGGGPLTLVRKLLASNRKIEGLESTTARRPGQTSCRATAG
jgi:8-oxo-dGTP diphosphatase